MTLQIRETVLTFISQNGQHHKLSKTKHFKHLKQLIVASGQPNQVKDLVDYLISQNWYVFFPQDQGKSISGQDIGQSGEYKFLLAYTSQITDIKFD